MRFSTVLPLVPVALAAAPIYNSTDAGLLVEDKYIVKLKDRVSLAAADDTLSALSTGADEVFSGGFNGFAATLDAASLEALREHPDVEYIEQDAVFTVPAVPDVDAVLSRLADPWNLIRISHRQLGVGTTYAHEQVGGAGTCIYILDSGIAATHPNFGGRAQMSANFAGGSNTDVNGHGTAIAGIAAASAWGVSRSATVYGVKVFNDNGSATTSVIVQGFNFVIQDAPSRNCPNGVFVNFAGAGGFSRALNVVAASVVSAGHFVSVDAGLGGVNVVNVSPASEPTVCTVGSTDRTDTVPSTSNFGAIDIYAPGFGVTSLRPTGGTALISAPLGSAHVVGLASYIATLTGGPANQKCAALVQLGTPGILNGVPGGGIMAFNGNPSG